MNESISRFAPFIREYIYREKWNTLHTLQEDAAQGILDRNSHILIAAGTARGKTEAAFFPILSILDTIFSQGEKAFVLYISPLKALINDQANRLEHLINSGKDTEEPAIPVWRWHGDIPGGSKDRFCEDPRGVLLITPESLESLLLRRNRELGRIMSALIFIVIDEVHVFMGSDRGSQLICHFSRIEKAIKDHVKQQNIPRNKAISLRRIGLSATLGDYDGSRAWLSQGTNLNTFLVEDNNREAKELSLALDFYTFRSPHKKHAEFFTTLYDQCRNKRTIIFTNSRNEAEECSASLSSLAYEYGDPDIFQIHHGSVSAMLRDEAEGNLKTGEGPQVICATATLELGIDIGDLDRIIQIGPPFSVSAFVQRLGRSGRRNDRAEMYFAINSFLSIKGSFAFPWNLLRTMAVIQLYLEEKWIEPPAKKPLPMSLLIHQTLAILASLGEHSFEDLASLLLSFPPFKGIPLSDFHSLMTWLEKYRYIGITEEGRLILGLEGERIVNHHSFYPVFPGEETFRIITDGREIGTVNFVPDLLSVLAVGGQRWIVKYIDLQKREIWVTETRDEGNERLWRGRGSEIHSRIIEKMKLLLMEIQEIKKNWPAETFNKIKSSFPYLSASACRALETGAEAAFLSEITAHPLITETAAEKENSALVLFPWTGSSGMRTIAAVLGSAETRKTLQILSVEEEEELYFRIITKASPGEFRRLLTETFHKALTADFLQKLINQKVLPYTDKYDYLLPTGLHARQYAANMLDMSVLEKLVKEL